jgi:hypothetical protein
MPINLQFTIIISSRQIRRFMMIWLCMKVYNLSIGRKIFYRKLYPSLLKMNRLVEYVWSLENSIIL